MELSNQATDKKKFLIYMQTKNFLMDFMYFYGPTGRLASSLATSHDEEYFYKKIKNLKRIVNIP